MRLFIDADACPVVDEALAQAKARGLEAFLICDCAHEINREGVQSVVVPKGADSADFKLLSLVRAGDAVITQDYGLAAMALALRCRVLRQDGLEYTNDNIPALLESRHISRKIRMSGGRTKGPPKRRPEQDRAFAQALDSLLTDMHSKGL